MATDYYTSDSRNLTFREYWNVSPNIFVFLLGAALKILRVKLPSELAVRYPEGITRIDNSEIPEFALRVAETYQQDLAPLGFESGFWYTIPVIGNVQGYGMCLQSRVPEILCVVNASRSYSREFFNDMSRCVFISQVNDGTILATTNNKPLALSPPEYQTERLLRRPLAEVYHRHRERVREAAAPVTLFHSESDIAAFLLEMEQQSIVFNESRGWYILASDAELERLRKFRRNPKAIPSPSSTRIWIAYACVIGMLVSGYQLLRWHLEDLFFWALNRPSMGVRATLWLSLLMVSFLILGVFGYIDEHKRRRAADQALHDDVDEI